MADTRRRATPLSAQAFTDTAKDRAPSLVQGSVTMPLGSVGRMTDSIAANGVAPCPSLASIATCNQIGASPAALTLSRNS